VIYRTGSCRGNALHLVVGSNLGRGRGCSDWYNSQFRSDYPKSDRILPQSAYDRFLTIVFPIHYSPIILTFAWGPDIALTYTTTKQTHVWVAGFTRKWTAQSNLGAVHKTNRLYHEDTKRRADHICFRVWNSTLEWVRFFLSLSSCLT
jgi:hypothetical protein